MGNRLSKIYTRTGDQGTTGLGDGRRISKTDTLIEAMGDLDELNSSIGLLLSCDLPQTARQYLSTVQHELFDLGAELSLTGGNDARTLIGQQQVDRLEHALDRLNAELPYLREFVLPGGTRAGAFAHLARSICRRAERHLAATAQEYSINPPALAYLNRLSDLLFVIARTLNRMDSENREVLWNREYRNDHR